MNKIIKQKIKDTQPYVNKAYENGEAFVSAYPDYDLNKLPSWVVENIDEAKIIGNSKKLSYWQMEENINSIIR